MTPQDTIKAWKNYLKVIQDMGIESILEGDHHDHPYCLLLQVAEEVQIATQIAEENSNEND